MCVVIFNALQIGRALFFFSFFSYSFAFQKLSTHLISYEYLCNTWVLSHSKQSCATILCYFLMLLLLLFLFPIWCSQETDFFFVLDKVVKINSSTIWFSLCIFLFFFRFSSSSSSVCLLFFFLLFCSYDRCCYLLNCLFTVRKRGIVECTLSFHYDVIRVDISLPRRMRKNSYTFKLCKLRTV